MTAPLSHHWIVGPSRQARQALAASLDTPPALVDPVDAHRRLRGPYTAAGSLLRELVPTVLVDSPELPGRFDIEILAAAPELNAIMPMARETLTSSAAVRERTRFYSVDRTTRLAHGMTEFLRDYLAGAGPRSLVVHNLEHADPTDTELIAILLRRLDPSSLTLIVCTGTEELDPKLATALARYADRQQAPESEPSTDPTSGTDAELAAAYVGAECLPEAPELRAAYDRLPADRRAALHDSRADELAALDEFSLRLGAIPFHRERGGDPRGAGVEALRFCIDHCSVMGFYDATVDFTVRARPLVDWSQFKLCHLVTARMALALIMTGRPDGVEDLYHEARLYTAEPEMHMTAAYSTAMLYTRHLRPEDIDHLKAKAWINQAIAFATTFSDPAERAFHTVFMENGLALIESHQRNYEEALRLVEEGYARLSRELRPEEHQLHRSVLMHNSGQVRVAAGRLEEALRDYSEAIEQDPNYAPYHFDRAGVLHRLGRDSEAIADYEAAIRLSPPLAEAYYNRGDVRAVLGDVEGALADFDYVTELSPEFVAAYVYRAGLYADLGEDELARRDVEAGLALEPGNPHLLSIRGQLHAAEGELAAARQAYDAAISAEPGLQAAWAGRATVAFDRGDLDGALNDLDQALELGDSAALRFNRATALIAAERWDDALADLNRAIELDPDDEDTVAERDRCARQCELARS